MKMEIKKSNHQPPILINPQSQKRANIVVRCMKNKRHWKFGTLQSM
jgi:hypothetical protein